MWWYIQVNIGSGNSLTQSGNKPDQCWHRFLSPYDVTKPQKVDSKAMDARYDPSTVLMHYMMVNILRLAHNDRILHYISMEIPEH